MDLERDLVGRGGLGVFTRHWDFRGHFWQGVVGSLAVYVGPGVRPDWYQKDLTSLDNLQELTQQELEKDYVRSNEEKRRKGQTEFIVTLPDSYRRVTIHNTEWLVYSLGGWKDLTVYVTPLTPAHYLHVGFDFIDNSKSQGYKTTWRRDAQALADQIAATLELRTVK